MLEYMEEATKIVESWPQWKREVLREPIQENRIMAAKKSAQSKAPTKTGIVWFDTLRSPKGRVGFNYLTDPDTRFDKDGKQRIQIFVDNKDPEVKAMVTKVMEVTNTFLKSIGKAATKEMPSFIKKAGEYEVQRFGEKLGVKEGDFFMEFNTKARYDDDGNAIPVELYDQQANKIDPTSKVRVFSGDTVRVSVRLGGYNAGGKVGLKVYLQGVQIVKKLPFEGGRKNPFEVEGEVDLGAAPAPTSKAPFEAEEDEPDTTNPNNTPAATEPTESPEESGSNVDLDELLG